MGKGARSNKKHAETFRTQQKEAEARESGLRRTRIIAVIAAAVVICAIAALFVRAFVRDTRNSNGYYMRNAVAVSNDKVSVDAAQMSYFFFNRVNNTLASYYSLYSSYYYNQYSTFSSFMKNMTGLDMSASMKTQYRGSVTWFDYFMDLAEKDVRSYIALYSKAVDSGMSLTEDDLANIKTRAAEVDLSNYSTGINTDDVENALKLKTLADIYKYTMADGIEITDAELGSYFDEHYTDYTYIDYMVFSFEYGTDGTVGTKDEAKEWADRAAASSSREDFEAIISEAVGKANAAESIDEAVITKKAFVESEAIKKLFDKEMKENDTFITDSDMGEGKGAYFVYMLLKSPYMDENKTVDVRHILISSYEEDDEKKAEAERIYALFEASDKSEEAFAELARRYSEDESSLVRGGLYRRVQEGGTTSAAFDEWCFGTERAPGDCGVTQTSYGYHVMYFAGYDLGRSMASAYDDLLDEKLLDAVAALEEVYPVSFDSEAYNTINT